jgi:DHA1 family tetracycline resistance protein-like MFS transporter
MIAPILFTQTFALAIGRFRGVKLPGAPFLVAAALLLCALAVAWRATSMPGAAGAPEDI